MNDLTAIIARKPCIDWLKDYFKAPKTNNQTLNLPTGTAFELIENSYAPAYKDGRHEGLVFVKGVLTATITFPVECSLEEIKT